MTQADFQAFDAVGALVVVLDVDDRIVYWNRTCSEIAGYSVAEVRGRRLWEFLLVPAEIEPVRAVLATLGTAPSPSRFAGDWVTKSGDRRWIAWSNTVTTGPDGRRYSIATGVDRTESKQAEDRLAEMIRDLAEEVANRAALAVENARLYADARAATRDLREANQQMVMATIRAHEQTEEAETARALLAKSERELREIAEFREMFIGILGHDLRNPIAAINFTAARMLRAGHLDEQAKTQLARIANSGGRVSRMISQLLDLTRARLGGGFALEPRPTDLRELCQAVVDEFEAPIHLEVEGDMTGVWDPDRLAEALSNVVGNAVEHATPGTVVVKARAEGADVVVEIANEGEPIPADVLPFIFEPFLRAKQRGKSPSGNLGLGLYIASEIVRAGFGTLAARSGDGTTTFVMRLPRQAPLAEDRTWQTERRA